MESTRRSVAAGERIGLVLTEGSRLKIRFAGMPWGLAEIPGFQKVQGWAGIGREETVIAYSIERCTAPPAG